MRLGRAVNPAMASRANCDSWTIGSCVTVWRRAIRAWAVMITSKFFNSTLVDNDPSTGVIRQPQAAELPARRRTEEVAIGHTRMALRRCLRNAAQHHLVDHEFAVIFTERTGRSPIARVRQVGATRPLPYDAESVVDQVGTRGHF